MQLAFVENQFGPDAAGALSFNVMAAVAQYYSDNPDIMLSGCVFRCAVCGFAITGEQIRRKLTDGGRNVHVYFKCGNNHQHCDHPKVRWREQELEGAIVGQLDSIRIPSPEIADWLRNALADAFQDATCTRTQWRNTLAKRKSELAGMQERLLNGYLSGLVDEAVFQTKSSELKREAEDVERQMDEAGNFDPNRGQLALSVFDFSQSLANRWHGSNFAVRRAILECVSSIRLVGDVSHCLEKRSPFGFVAERAFLKDSRGDEI